MRLKHEIEGRFGALNEDILRFIAKKACERKRKKFHSLDSPKRMVFFVTNRCNLRCPHCFLLRKTDQISDELTADEIDRIVANSGNLEEVHLTGGEPALRNDLLEVCLLFLRRVRTLVIDTNGTLPNVVYTTLKELSQRYPERNILLMISVDGPKSVHDEIRGKGTFDKVMETINLIKGLNINIVIVTTISRSNMNILDEIATLTKNLPRRNLRAFKPIFDGFEYIHCINLTRGLEHVFNLEEDLIDYHNPSDPTTILSLEENERVYRKLLELDEKHHFWLRHLQLLWEYPIRVLKERRKLFDCYAGFYDGVIHPNGNVSFCEYTKPIANLRDFDYSLKKIWRSEIAERRRELTKKCFCVHSIPLLATISVDENYMYEAIRSRSLVENLRHVYSYLVRWGL